MQLDPQFSQKIGQIVLLGGAFAVNGNVNPASEANVCYAASPYGLLLLFLFLYGFSLAYHIICLQLDSKLYQI